MLALSPERQALSPKEAAAVLGVSESSFQRHVQPHLKAVRVGRLVRFPVDELQRYVGKAK